MRWPRQHPRLLAGISLVVAAYCAAGFLWVPRIAQSAIDRYVREDLHRQVTIGALTFNPLTLTVRATGFSLNEADGADIASFDTLVVNFQLSSVIHRAFTFKTIRLDNPSVLVRVNADGTLNLTQIVPPDTTPVVIPRVRIGTFAIHGGHVKVEDRSRPTPFTATLAPIEFSLTDFRTEPQFGNVYQFAASTPDNERLAWSGEFSVQPLGSTGRFSLANIKATTIASYLQDALPFDLQSGTLDIQGSYALAFENQTRLTVTLPSIQARGVGIAVRANEPASPWITLPVATIAGMSVALPARTVSIDSVSVAGAVIDAWREADGTLNLSRLAPPPGQDAARPIAATVDTAAPWTIGVKTVHIDSARINVEDRTLTPAAKLTLSPIDIAVAGYSTSPNSTLTLDARVGVNEKGQLTAKGPVTLAPLAMTLNLGVTRLDLTALQPYAAHSTGMTIRSGELAMQTTMHYVAEPARGQPRLTFTGDAGVTNFRTTDNALNQDFIRWESLAITGLSYQEAPDRLTIERIHAREPYGRVVIAADGAFNITQVLNPAGAPAVTPTTTGTPAPAEPMPTRIRSVLVEGGSASFADYTVTPSFATEIGGINGSVDGLSSDSTSRAIVRLDGSVDTYAPVAISGEVNLLARDAYTDIAMSFRNMELATFNPYSGKFAGYSIAKGKLTTEMQYKVQNRELDARHHIVIDQLEFGDATDSKDAVSLPIKLAVALLKDRNGVIDLDLPITGNIDDPSFHVGPILWQVLKNTLEKLVTSPFALLGKLVGGGDDLAFVDFSYGSSALSAEASERLGKLREAMAERPQLRLDIPLQSVDTADANALARSALDSAIAPLLAAMPDRLAALGAVYSREFGAAPTYPAMTDSTADTLVVRTRFLEGTLLTKLAPTSAQLDAIGRARSSAVRDALLGDGAIVPERVFLSARASDVAAPTPVARMELKLE